jgi:hypothetical protein
MSKPAPSSRTKNQRVPLFARTPTLMCAGSRWAVNFQALLSRFSSATRVRRGSHSGEVARDGHLHAAVNARFAQRGDDVRGDRADVDALDAQVVAVEL